MQPAADRKVHCVVLTAMLINSFHDMVKLLIKNNNLSLDTSSYTE